MHRIIVLDSIAQEGLDILDAEPGVEYDVRTGLKGEELRQALTEYDGAILRSGVKITPESVAGNTRLKALVRAGVGTDNIDKPAATRQGIVVMNTPTGNTVSTAEHAFALMMSLSRNIAAANQSLVEGRWDRKLYMGNQLAGKTLGIVGMGRIGREVASRAKAFEMRVVGYDPFLTEEQAAKLGIDYAATVDDLLPQIDYLTVHTPLTPETTNLVSKANLEKLKPGVRLINAARGGIYDEEALIEGLDSGKIGGVALDVYPNEPCTDSPLFGRPNVVCTPHLGASTEEAQTQVAVEGIHLLINFLKTGEIRHAVNVAALDPKTLADMKGFLNVAHRLGVLLAQWHGGGIASVQLHYRGEIASKSTQLLTSAFCAGLLENALEEEVNVINAEVLLRDRGIDLVAHQHHEMGSFTSSMTVEVSGGDRSVKASGALLGHNMPRLVMLDDHRLESYLDGKLLIFTHADVPGIIGRVGTVFGQHNVNIGQMAVGRAGGSQGSRAVGVLNLDGVPSQAALDEVQAIEAIDHVCVIELPPADQLPAWLQA
ncbi:D-3-phosphoglycerate dehydrogenase [Rosistilla oblonga]|uniref:D-3-phosphoglycerate dehydrogenase n=1 Tax=Rosistilla oblonga TaxID=2527990 RepID=A0A518IPK2_9BACT|nr:phosphoglycerate dehydrogenase [Rosistilla oblonga]QDV11081.1 D-3-phosphoglycerate dehydrogenase [Rosistilla oblonga]QDV55002.1 D-3-phosphoglycerate dehydrogenase [Rosistilla oblonga]